MTDILRIFFIVILLPITLAAYFLVIGALFTSRVTKTQSIINQTSGRAFGLGLVNFFFFGEDISGKRRSPSTLTMPVSPRLNNTARKARMSKAGMVSTPLTKEPAFSARDSITNAIKPKKKKFTNPSPKARPEVWLMML